MWEMMLISLTAVASTSDHHHNKIVKLLRSGSEKRSLEAQVCGLRPGYNTPEMARIIGGTDAKEGEVPWQAGLLLGGKLECGGAIVSRRAIVTAAHCLKYPASNYTVVVGRLGAPSQKPECQQQNFLATAFFPHPDYQPNTLSNDLAIVSIASVFGQGVQWTSSVLPLCLPAPGSAGIQASPPLLWKEGEEGLVTGYGLTMEEGEPARTLQKAAVPVVPRAQCAAAYKAWINVDPITQFCAGGSQSGTDACTGDSGGPLAASAGGRFYLAGVVSFGKGCGRKDFPGVYTRVEPYLPWLLKVVAKADQGLAISSTNSISLTPSSVTSATTPATAPPAPSYSPSYKTSTPRPTSDSQPVLSVGPVCSGYYRVLRCPTGQVITVVEAFFGRSSVQDCRYRSRGAPEMCQLASAKQEQEAACGGRRMCLVSTRAINRGGTWSKDPCPHSRPYVELSYTCSRNQGQ